MSVEPKTAEPAESEAGRRRAQAAQALRAAKDALSREHILDAAERVFADGGFASARMQDVAREAGISLATLYQFYPGKRELHRAILIARDNEMLEAVLQKVQASLERPQSMVQMLWVQRAHMQFLLGHTDYLRLILQEGYAWYHAAAQPTSDEQQIWERGIAAIEQVLAWGIAAGHMVGGKGPDQARMVLALQQTRLANWVADGMHEAHDAVIERVQTDFVRFFCRPAVALDLLTEDGAGLKPAVLAQIEQLDEAA
ncbi:TetR/AcrR family transcriptional regulator [Oleomonas cavernae]|uniref:TetR/AcrR family transcriptional regulator n=1 Tax=Oleomonas cavernae TaxID=2320859 RepID=A0A418W939_9PROT|nr:TetR/AcrR family transcriptional regulator [Oleomonas cavernae]RJF86506.1 TetR/AcrR family transcriptional regulator [Oleomonas cavernae]